MPRRGEAVRRKQNGRDEMAGLKKRRKKRAVVPRLGPATNLRPAGAHESRKRYNRRKSKAALQRDVENLDPGDD